MPVHVSIPQQAEFVNSHPDNLLLIENNIRGVTIHAVYDNFSARDKSRLIHYLAEEGFIPDRFKWFSNPGAELDARLTWIVDRSWLGVPLRARHKALRQVLRVTLGATMVWLALMTFAFLHAARLLK